MVKIDELIEKYIEYSLNIHNTNDFSIKKKYIDKNVSLVDKIFKYNYQDAFFTYFFESKEPFILYDIAIDSLNREYDIEKSYEIVMYLKENAYNLIFSSDEEINKKAQQEFHNAEYTIFEEEYNIYKKLGNKKTYHDYQIYWKLLNDQYSWYTKNTFNPNYYKPWDAEICELLSKIKDLGILDKFIKITTDRFEKGPSYIKVVNAYYVWKFTNDKSTTLKTFADILNLDKKYLTTKLINLIAEYKKVMDGTLKLEYKTIPIKDDKQQNKNMKYLPGLLDKYVEVTLNLYHAESLTTRNKYIKQQESIVDKVYKYNYQDEFFTWFFDGGNPFLLYSIALESLNREYDIEKSYEIAMYLKENAYNLTFSSDEEINKKAQQEFHNSDSKYNRFIEEYNMYKKFSNKQLYHDFHQYWRLLTNHYAWYTNNTYNENSYKPWDEEIKELLNSIKERNELEEFLEITSERLDSCELISRAMNAFYVWQYTNNKEWTLKKFDEVLHDKKFPLPVKLPNLIEEYKQVIDDTLKIKNDK